MLQGSAFEQGLIPGHGSCRQLQSSRRRGESADTADPSGANLMRHRSRPILPGGGVANGPTKCARWCAPW